MDDFRVLVDTTGLFKDFKYQPCLKQLTNSYNNYILKKLEILLQENYKRIYFYIDYVYLSLEL